MDETIAGTTKIRKTSLYEVIVERLRNMIPEGRLKTGDRLPSERDLAGMFQVDREVVHEAMKILEFMGIVQYVRGDGFYLKRLDTDELLSRIDFVIESGTDILSDLFEVREALELKAVELAARRRTEADLLAMERVIGIMADEIGGGKNGIDAATDFHTAVSKASKNKVIARINDLLIDLTEISRRKSMRETRESAGSLGHHRFILERIREQDADGAREAMAAHLMDARHRSCHDAQR